MGKMVYAPAMPSKDSPLVMDLGDFIPEEYTLRFKIREHSYEVCYAEATVDEVFRMIVDNPPESAGGMMEKRREIVLGFLCGHLKKGDAEQLKKDMVDVPYTSLREGLDIQTLYARLTSRVKKNAESGDGKEKA